MYTHDMNGKVLTDKHVRCTRAPDESRLVLDSGGYEAFLKTLDERAQPNAKLKLLMASKTPWEK